MRGRKKERAAETKRLGLARQKSASVRGVAKNIADKSKRFGMAHSRAVDVKRRKRQPLKLSGWVWPSECQQVGS